MASGREGRAYKLALYHLGGGGCEKGGKGRGGFSFDKGKMEGRVGKGLHFTRGTGREGLGIVFLLQGEAGWQGLRRVFRLQGKKEGRAGKGLSLTRGAGREGSSFTKGELGGKGWEGSSFYKGKKEGSVFLLQGEEGGKGLPFKQEEGERKGW